jgi:hypothetical protein
MDPDPAFDCDGLFRAIDYRLDAAPSVGGRDRGAQIPGWTLLGWIIACSVVQRRQESPESSILFEIPGLG